MEIIAEPLISNSFRQRCACESRRVLEDDEVIDRDFVIYIFFSSNPLSVFLQSAEHLLFFFSRQNTRITCSLRSVGEINHRR